MQDLERTCSDHFRRRYWGVGLGFGFRVVSNDPNFKKLSVDAIASVYRVSQNRAILFDYDRTLMPQNSMSKMPSQEVISILETLCADSRNTIFIVSGRGKDSLSNWFSPCKKLGIAAEHGYFLRWPENEDWENCGQSTDFGWMEIAEPVMQLYTEATDGSYIESKESALVWHYQDVDPDFGTVGRICFEADKVFNQAFYFKKTRKHVRERVSHVESIASSAVRAAIKVNASAIICFTASGRAARLLAKYRPTMPVLSVVLPRLITTQIRWTFSGAFEARQSLIVRGFFPMLADPRHPRDFYLEEGAMVLADGGVVCLGLVSLETVICNVDLRHSC